MHLTANSYQSRNHQWGREWSERIAGPTSALSRELGQPDWSSLDPPRCRSKARYENNLHGLDLSEQRVPESFSEYGPRELPWWAEQSPRKEAIRKVELGRATMAAKLRAQYAAIRSRPRRQNWVQALLVTAMLRFGRVICPAKMNAQLLDPRRQVQAAPMIDHSVECVRRSL